MAGGQVSSVELTEAAIARIERHDPTINAVCVRDFARRARRRASRRLGPGPRRGRAATGRADDGQGVVPRHGLPITWGAPAFAGHLSDADALAVARVKAAGAVVLGKTNVPLGLGDVQTYNGIYGTTRNPWDPGRTPGGSSGGSAAALAAGYGALSLGSDIAGSLRNPAHFCGVYAHKPTYGLVPTRGHTPPSVPVLPGERDLAVVGPMARTAADLARLLDPVAEPDELALGAAHRLALPPARHDDLAAYRVLLLDTHPLIPTSADVRAELDRFAERLTGSGATVARHSPLLPDQVESAGLYLRLLLSVLNAGFPPRVHEMAGAMAAELDDDDRSLGAERARGAAPSHRDWIIADAGRNVPRQRWRALFTEFDVVVCPVMPTPAFPLDESDQMTRRIDIDGTDHDYLNQLVFAGVATLPGLPATAFPIGSSGDGLPIGPQAVGPMFGDRTTIAFAELTEREFGGFTPPPLDRP